MQVNSYSNGSSLFLKQCLDCLAYFEYFHPQRIPFNKSHFIEINLVPL